MTEQDREQLEQLKQEFIEATLQCNRDGLKHLMKFIVGDDEHELEEIEKFCEEHKEIKREPLDSSGFPAIVSVSGGIDKINCEGITMDEVMEIVWEEMKKQQANKCKKKRTKKTK